MKINCFKLFDKLIFFLKLDDDVRSCDVFYFITNCIRNHVTEFESDRTIHLYFNPEFTPNMSREGALWIGGLEPYMDEEFLMAALKSSGENNVISIKVIQLYNPYKNGWISVYDPGGARIC